MFSFRSVLGLFSLVLGSLFLIAVAWETPALFAFTSGQWLFETMFCACVLLTIFAHLGMILDQTWRNLSGYAVFAYFVTAIIAASLPTTDLLIIPPSIYLLGVVLVVGWFVVLMFDTLSFPSYGKPTAN